MSVDLNGCGFEWENSFFIFYHKKLSKTQRSNGSKKMESAFLKGLHHILSKKFTYIVVADRGFGNQRFASECIKNGFHYVLRMNNNLGITVKNEQTNIENYVGTKLCWN